jgi:hypothetical protein
MVPVGISPPYFLFSKVICHERTGPFEKNDDRGEHRTTRATFSH